MNQNFFAILLLCWTGLTGGSLQIENNTEKTGPYANCSLSIYTTSEGIEISQAGCDSPVVFHPSKADSRLVREGEPVEEIASGESHFEMSPTEMLTYGAFRILSPDDNPCLTDGNKEGGAYQQIRCGPKTASSFGRTCNKGNPDFYITTFCYASWVLDGSAMTDFEAVKAYAKGTDHMLEEMSNEYACTLTEARGEGLTSLITSPELDYVIAIMWRDRKTFSQYQLLVDEHLVYE